MPLKQFFKSSEPLVSIDIGATAIKLTELDLSSSVPKLTNVGIIPLGADIFSGYQISKTEKLAEKITHLLEANSIQDKRVVTCVPSPSVFTKKIKMGRLSLAELSENIKFEAGNLIPHNVDAVKLDFHVLGASGKSQLDVLLVAVKNEIIDSYLDSFSLAGVEVAIVDVDAFSLQNVFEFCYPEAVEKTVALINMGMRYTTINICRGGESLILGDVSIGGKHLTDQIAEATDLSAEDIEKAKKLMKDPAVVEVVDRYVENTAAELNRQLSFLLNASGEDRGIDTIYLTGGASQVKGLKEELAEKTGVEVEFLDPLKGFEGAEDFDAAYLNEVRPFMAISLGMAMRQPGDKEMVDAD